MLKSVVTVLMTISCCSCSAIAEYRVELSGSTQPRNKREKIIFDYFNALRIENYREAYQFLYPSKGRDFHVFSSYMAERRKYLPRKISIGKEKKIKIENSSICDYSYDVYTVDPGSYQLIKGELSLAKHPNQPNFCVIRYNSAFGGL